MPIDFPIARTGREYFIGVCLFARNSPREARGMRRIESTSIKVMTLCSTEFRCTITIAQGGTSLSLLYIRDSLGPCSHLVENLKYFSIYHFNLSVFKYKFHTNVLNGVQLKP